MDKDKNQNEMRKEIGIEEKLTVGQSLFYGVQSVISLNLFLGAIIIAGILQMDVIGTAILITLSFLASGISTLIQAGLFMKYPIVQGVSFVTIGALCAVAFTHDLATAFGSLILGAVILIALGQFKLFGYIMKVIPPIVAGLVIMLIAVNVGYIAIDGLITAPGNVGGNFMLAAIAFVLILVFKTIGNTRWRIATICGRGGVLFAIIIAVVIAALTGQADFSIVAQASWVSAPPFFHFGFPKFDLASSLVFIVVYIITMIETIGGWFAISHTAKVPITKKDIDKGIVGEGISCVIAAFVGSAPVTSYATNAGVISITKVYSRWAAVGAGVIIVVLSFIPKLMYLIASIPVPILLGVLIALCASMFGSGLRSIHRYPITERNFLIITVPIFLTLLANMLPMSIIGAMPMLLSYFFSSSICIGAVSAIILNLVLPKAPEDRALEANESGHLE